MNVIQSNEPWLDAVPADWTSSRIRNVAQLSPSYSNGQPAGDEPCTVVPMELLSETGMIDITASQAIEDVSGGLTQRRNEKSTLEEELENNESLGFSRRS